MSEKIDYKKECRAWLALKSTCEKVTQKQYCERRSQEIGKTMSLPYFKKTMMGVKREVNRKIGDTGKVPDQNCPISTNITPKVRSAKRRWHTKRNELFSVEVKAGVHSVVIAVYGPTDKAAGKKGPEI